MPSSRIESVRIPAPQAAQIARFLTRCARHEDERAQGRVTFPLLTMKELAMEANHWAKYLEARLPQGSSTASPT